MKKKDYHKGKKINAFIPEELHQLLESNAARYGTTKSRIIVDALYSYIGPAARDSIHKAQKSNVFKDNNPT